MFYCAAGREGAHFNASVGVQRGTFFTAHVLRNALNVVALTSSSAPSRPGPDDRRHCIWSHRLPDRHLRTEVSENGEHGGQRQSHDDPDSRHPLPSRRYSESSQCLVLLSPLKHSALISLLFPCL